MSSHLFNNQDKNSLFEKFKSIFENKLGVHTFYALSGFIRSSGYFKLQPYLEKAEKIKLLVGIDVDNLFSNAYTQGLQYSDNSGEAKSQYINDLAVDIRDAKYTREVENGMLTFFEHISSGKIALKIHPSKKLHAKFYVFLPVEPDQFNSDSYGSVIMGSSNLTADGLGIKQPPNYELNVLLRNYDDVKFAKDEFERLWNEGVELKPEDITNGIDQTHLSKKLPTPYELYLKCLISYFDKDIDYDPYSMGDLPPGYKSLDYQVEAINQGYRMLCEHNGFFLADVVGTGKTLIATMIAQRFSRENGSHTKILVIYPPHLESTWLAIFREAKIQNPYFISNGSLHHLFDEQKKYPPINEYSLIIVDEAHRFRSENTTMFSYLQRITKATRPQGNVAGNQKKVILISATPLNNKPEDIENLLYIFQHKFKSTIRNINLNTYFANKNKKYNDAKDNLKSAINESARQQALSEIENIYKAIRQDIISHITIRRTRTDLTTNEQYNKNLIDQNISFPTVAPPSSINYELTDKLALLFQKTVNYVTDTQKIQFFRYQAIGYLTEDNKKRHYPKATAASMQLAGIMKTFMVKRLESSFEAFKSSLNNLFNSTSNMIEGYRNNKVVISDELDSMLKKGYDWYEVEEFFERNPNKGKVFQCTDFLPEYIKGLEADLKMLGELKKEWDAVDNDPKWDTFTAILAGNHPTINVKEKTINPTGKLVVFTESAVTAQNIYEKMSEEQKNRALCITSNNRKEHYKKIKENFDANVAKTLQQNNIDFIITTDVLAEGINLHRCNVIINYDTPWNATRLMQRIGRINRIGSIAGTVYNYNFYPSTHGENELKLYPNTLIKLQSFHTAYGEDAQIYSHEELVNQFELYDIQNPAEKNEDLQYLQEIRNIKKDNPALFKKIERLPAKARTGRSAKDADKPACQHCTVAFLKSAYKKAFFLVDMQNKAKEISFIDAVKILKASSEELAYPLPKHHYDHVNECTDQYKRVEITENPYAPNMATKQDKASAKAQKFLRSLNPFITTDEQKQLFNSITDALQKGIYSNMVKEIIAIESDNSTIANKVELIEKLAQKYHLNDDSDVENAQPPINNTPPAIVLSETFV
ncbi:MAG: AAA family ATPase [Chitinophagia bacterium]|nr:AAA family ATPase [Chitinophagia bacterium]